MCWPADGIASQLLCLPLQAPVFALTPVALLRPRLHSLRLLWVPLGEGFWPCQVGWLPCAYTRLSACWRGLLRGSCCKLAVSVWTWGCAGIEWSAVVVCSCFTAPDTTLCPIQPAGAGGSPNSRAALVDMGRGLAQHGFSVEQAVNSGLLGGFSAFDVRPCMQPAHPCVLKSLQGGHQGPLVQGLGCAKAGCGLGAF